MVTIEEAKARIASAETVLIDNEFKKLSCIDTKLLIFYRRKDAVKYLKAVGLPSSCCQRLETRFHIFYGLNMGRNEFVVFSKQLLDDANAIISHLAT